MEFRPCIDIHNGQVKQIVGSSLKDENNEAKENFVASKGAEYYAELYKSRNIKGGHIILLNPASSDFYSATKEQALNALKAYPGGLQVGGGINDTNAAEFLEAGASHVVVTSFVFKDGMINMEHLKKIYDVAGKEHLVLDLSCRYKDGEYYIVTDRWQKYTQEIINNETLDMLKEYCDEFLIHAVDVEGKSQGIEQELVKKLGSWKAIKGNENHAITYAGGVHSYEDVELLRRLGSNNINVTIGSSLDIFGGTLEFERIVDMV